jgi:hypothetical protein
VELFFELFLRFGAAEPRALHDMGETYAGRAGVA